MPGHQPAVGRAATAADLPAVAGCLASAFFDDPLWGRWAFPDATARARDIAPFMRLMAELDQGDLWTDMTAGGEAVTVWTPPGQTYGAGVPPERFAADLGEIFGPRAAALEALFEQFDANLPAGEYWHLEWWGTHRDHAGRGLGGALLRENLARIDAERLPCYLESTNPGNVPRYEALGFERIGAFAPPGGPTVDTMWRTAR